MKGLLTRIFPRRRWAALTLIGPPAIWLLVFLVFPYAALLAQSFLATDAVGDVVLTPTVAPWRTLIKRPLYVDTLLYTFRIAALVTALCLAVSVPLAYVIAFKVKRHKQLLFTLITVPLWVSYIVRAYAWKIILGREGLLNTFLMYTGVVDHPVEAFLYSPLALVIGLVHIFTPFVLMPVYTAFEHIPRPLVEASQDLGAGRLTTFRRVVLPLALPGMIAGATLAFVLSLGDFLSATLLGGPDTLVIASVVQNLFGTSDDRPLGSAVGIVLLVLVIGVLEATSRAERALGGHGIEAGRVGRVEE